MPRARKQASQADIAAAVAAFEQQRQDELAVELAPLPATRPQTATAAPEKSWADTVRSWSSHGNTGVHHVTAKVPMGEHGIAEMTGVRFDEDRKRTDEEKPILEAEGLKHYRSVKSWLKPDRGGAFEETQALAERIAERRRGEERGR